MGPRPSSQLPLPVSGDWKRWWGQGQGAGSNVHNRQLGPWGLAKLLALADGVTGHCSDVYTTSGGGMGVTLILALCEAQDILKV